MTHPHRNPIRYPVSVLLVVAMAAGCCLSAPAFGQVEAEQILAASKIQRGNCLVIGPGSSRLAAELHRHGNLRLYAVEPDDASVQAAREHIDALGIYGKVTVHEGDLGRLDFAPLYFHMLVFDLTARQVTEEVLTKMYRLLRPGGKAFLLVAPDKAKDWRKLMTSLGLAQRDISQMPGGGCIVYSRPGPDPTQDWRGWFGGPFHQCATHSPEFKPPLVEIWSARMLTSARHNWVVPIIGDGVVVYHEWQFGCINGHDPYTGELLWTHPSSFPDNAGVHKRLWMSVPAIAGGTTLVATSLEEVTCIDLKTGKTLWVKPIPADIDWDQMPRKQSLRHLAVHDGKYYLLVNKERAVYWDPQTGDETSIKPLLPYRAYTKVGKYVFYPENWNYSHQPMTWTVKAEGSDEALYTFRSSGRPRFCIAEDQRVLLYNGWDGYRALDLDTQEHLWGGPVMAWSCGSATYAGGYAFATASGATYCMDVRTGRIAWMVRNSNSCVPPAIANGILYTMSNNSLRLRAMASRNLLTLPARRSK